MERALIPIIAVQNGGIGEEAIIFYKDVGNFKFMFSQFEIIAHNWHL